MKNSRSSQLGMSLIEIMVMIAIIGVITVGISVSLGSMKRSQVKSAANQLATAIRHARSKAVTSNGYFRIQINIDRGEYRLEYSEKAPLFSKGTLGNSEKNPPATPNKNEATSLDDDDPTKATPASFQAFEDTSSKLVQFKKEIVFKNVRTDKEAMAASSGKVYLYFFPDGHGEQAVICIGQKNETGSDFLIRVKPLTGKVTVEPGCTKFSNQ